MLAELHGKFDPDNAYSVNGVDRSEDLLTAAVFGAIRHLPRSVLGDLLSAAKIPHDRRDLHDASIRLWPMFPLPRWGGPSIEPDVVVVVGKQPVVFEAKLYSDFSMHSNPVAPVAEPHHQLAAQYAAVAAWAAGERLQPPVVVAVTAPPRRPIADLERAETDLRRLAPDAPPGRLHWLPWFRIADVISAAADGQRVHEKALTQDVLAYMEKRGVRRVFTGFRPEDYWLVAAAQRVAADRVYPQVREFLADLTAVLEDDGITWSTPQWKAMWLPGGASVDKPADWRRGWMGVLLWPQRWPARPAKLQAYNAIYVLFDFVNPAIEVGFNIPGPGVGVAQREWPALVAPLVAGLHALSRTYEIALDAGDLASPTRTVTSDVVDEAWITNAIAVMTTTSHLRLRTRTDPFSLTVVGVRDQILELREDMETLGDAVWSLLRSVGYLT